MQNTSIRVPPRGVTLLVLATCLLGSEIAYLALLRLEIANGVQPVLTFLVWFAVLFVLYAVASLVLLRVGHLRFAVGLVAGPALLFRLTLLPAGLPNALSWGERLDALMADVRGDAVLYERFLLFDDDLWRYLWEGHVGAHGANPYRYAPADAALDALAGSGGSALTDGLGIWADIREYVNHADVPTIYPPLAQALFRFSHWLAPGSVFVLKALLASCDLIAALFIAMTLRALGQPLARTALYAWNPLVIKVFAGSGHVDALLVATLAALAYFVAISARLRAGGVFALAVLAKLSPLVLLPFVIKRTGWRPLILGALIVVGGYAPFMADRPALFDGFRTFAQYWQFNAGLFALLQWTSSLLVTDADMFARALSGLMIFAALVILRVLDPGNPEMFGRVAASASGAVLLFGPVMMPWYVTWILPFAVIANDKAWLWLSGLVSLAIVVMVDGREHAWVLWIEYGAFVGVVLATTPRLRLPRIFAEIRTHEPDRLGVRGCAKHDPRPAWKCRGVRECLQIFREAPTDLGTLRPQHSTMVDARSAPSADPQTTSVVPHEPIMCWRANCYLHTAAGALSGRDAGCKTLNSQRLPGGVPS